MKRLIYLTMFCVLFVSCFKSSTFVPDKTNSSLPEYSEEGRNIAGAILNDSTWISDVYISSLGGIYMRGFWILSNLSGDSTTIKFDGKYEFKSIKLIDTLPAFPINLFIVLKDVKIGSQNDLLQLNNKTFTIDGITNKVALSYPHPYDTSIYQKFGVGTITFNKVQKDTFITYGDGSLNNPIINPFILSGHFSFTFDGTKYEMKDGRFDMVALLNTNFAITQ